MSRIILTPEDIKQIEQMGISKSQISSQLKMFNKGSSFCQLLRPATINDGIKKLSKKKVNHFISSFENSLDTKKIIKFVPASGAATRMLETLLSLYKTRGEIREKEIKKKAKKSEKEARFFLEFIQGLKQQKFAFFHDLKLSMSKRGIRLEDLIKQGRYKEILKYLLTQQGLNYAGLPKALLKFHKYGQNSRTALEEHLIEGEEYAKDKNGIVRIHFTLSAEFKPEVQNYLDNIIHKYESISTRYKITFSIQKTSTHTLAVNGKNQPFKDNQGRMVFRPGGHGALIENLNELDEDLVFIKNIDNVVPDHLKKETFTYKKALAGYLVVLQKRIFDFLQQLSAKKISNELLEEIKQFCQEEMFFIFPSEFSNRDLKGKAHYLFEKLNRPIRVCGMVKNEGEPGGGPFWVKDKKDQISLQIIEKSQINTRSDEQKAMFSVSTHFNPVDLVCGLRNFQGEKFNLLKYIDPDTFFISVKSIEEKPIKALELPGLWNGAMAKWITLFVEIPISTFNPVKTINDLLRKEHQQKIPGLTNYCLFWII